MGRRPALVASTILLLAGCSPSRPGPRTVAAASSPTSASVFEKLKALAGEWEGAALPGRTIRIRYDVIARGTALAETYTTPSGTVTMTLYHLDGPHLMLTHYCAQGNQPRLRLETVVGDPRSIAFALVDGTNLTGRGAHMRRLRVTFEDAEHFTQEATYLDRGKDEVTAIRFARLAPPPRR